MDWHKFKHNTSSINMLSYGHNIIGVTNQGIVVPSWSKMMDVTDFKS